MELTGDKPRKHTIGSGRSGEPGDRETGDAALPAGWEELSDANGDTYMDRSCKPCRDAMQGALQLVRPPVQLRSRGGGADDHEGETILIDLIG